ncbi:MAG TPA: type II toxin-antitoxin system VapC family toxin [Thermomicrobiales bacterium]|nr:type II toxin-antitoxin system VapC family toxin [Thermomicrobiales bacterium]
MPHLLDSDVMIDRLDGDPATVDLMRHLAPSGVAISIVTYMETYQGVLRNPRSRGIEARFNALMAIVPVMDFTIGAAERCAALRQTLSEQGRRVRPRALDLITASIALEHDLTLVTRITADYDDIPGLKLYAW